MGNPRDNPYIVLLSRYADFAELVKKQINWGSIKGMHGVGFMVLVSLLGFAVWGWWFGFGVCGLEFTAWVWFGIRSLGS
jgi:hypothetical protein